MGGWTSAYTGWSPEDVRSDIPNPIARELRIRSRLLVRHCRSGRHELGGPLTRAVGYFGRTRALRGREVSIGGLSLQLRRLHRIADSSRRVQVPCRAGHVQASDHPDAGWTLATTRGIRTGTWRRLRSRPASSCAAAPLRRDVRRRRHDRDPHAPCRRQLRRRRSQSSALLRCGSEANRARIEMSGDRRGVTAGPRLGPRVRSHVAEPFMSLERHVRRSVGRVRQWPRPAGRRRDLARGRVIDARAIELTSAREHRELQRTCSRQRPLTRRLTAESAMSRQRTGVCDARRQPPDAASARYSEAADDPRDGQSRTTGRRWEE